jgi:hypothetical protein
MVGLLLLLPDTIKHAVQEYALLTYYFSAQLAPQQLSKRQ